MHLKLSRLESVAQPRAENPDELDAALKHFYNFTRDAAGTWQRLDFKDKLRFQKLLFHRNTVPFDGTAFGTAQLSPIFALSEAYDGNDTNVVMY